MKVPYDIDQFPQYPQNIIEFIDTISEHSIIANCGYTRETGEEELDKGHAQMISYGTLFIANPDLPKRFELNAELNEVDKTTMYSGQDKGYIDYPFLHN
jgi:N-ethylmaleimide reductase